MAMQLAQRAESHRSVCSCLILAANKKKAPTTSSTAHRGSPRDFWQRRTTAIGLETLVTFIRQQFGQDWSQPCGIVHHPYAFGLDQALAANVFNTVIRG
jgi:hypothetical protein